MQPLARVAALLVSLAFARAALAKVVARREWALALQGYGLPGPLRRASLVLVPVVEAAVPLLILAVDVRAGAALTLALLASFSAAILWARARRGDKLPCGCFGRSRTRDFRVLLVRDAVLGILAAPAIAWGPRAGLAASGPEAGDVPALLAVVGALLIAWTVQQSTVALRAGSR